MRNNKKEFEELKELIKKRDLEEIKQLIKSKLKKKIKTKKRKPRRKNIKEVKTQELSKDNKQFTGGQTISYTPPQQTAGYIPSKALTPPTTALFPQGSTQLDTLKTSIGKQYDELKKLIEESKEKPKTAIDIVPAKGIEPSRDKPILEYQPTQEESNEPEEPEEPEEPKQLEEERQKIKITILSPKIDIKSYDKENDKWNIYIDDENLYYNEEEIIKRLLDMKETGEINNEDIKKYLRLMRIIREEEFLKNPTPIITEQPEEPEEPEELQTEQDIAEAIFKQGLKLGKIPGLKKYYLFNIKEDGFYSVKSRKKPDLPTGFGLLEYKKKINDYTDKNKNYAVYPEKYFRGANRIKLIDTIVGIKQ